MRGTLNVPPQELVSKADAPAESNNSGAYKSPNDHRPENRAIYILKLETGNRKEHKYASAVRKHGDRSACEQANAMYHLGVNSLSEQRGCKNGQRNQETCTGTAS